MTTDTNRPRTRRRSTAVVAENEISPTPDTTTSTDERIGDTSTDAAATTKHPSSAARSTQDPGAAPVTTPDLDTTPGSPPIGPGPGRLPRLPASARRKATITLPLELDARINAIVAESARSGNPRGYDAKSAVIVTALERLVGELETQHHKGRPFALLQRDREAIAAARR